MEKVKIIILGIIGVFTVIGIFGIFWMLIITNIQTTMSIQMDDNTLQWLKEHDYCLITEYPPFDSNESRITFMGDCKYSLAIFGVE